jgi:hypothetical protein
MEEQLPLNKKVKQGSVKCLSLAFLSPNGTAFFSLSQWCVIFYKG